MFSLIIPIEKDFAGLRDPWALENFWAVHQKTDA